jgi:hypothetical protein
MLRYIEFLAPNRAVMARTGLPVPAPDEALIETVLSRNYAGDATASETKLLTAVLLSLV